MARAKRFTHNDNNLAFIYARYSSDAQRDCSIEQQIEEAKFSNWKGRKVDTISIRFDVTEWESERSILHCYAEVQFRNLTKRTIIEIDVNKRNFLD